MKVRKAAKGDAAGIAKVHVDSWRTTYKDIIPTSFLEQLSYTEREQMWAASLREGHVYVAESDSDGIVGFACGGKERSGKYEGYDGELYAVYLLAEYQGKGIGKSLFKAVLQHLHENRLTSMVVLVLEDNEACKFYESMGGKKIGRLKDMIGGKTVYELIFGWEKI